MSFFLLHLFCFSIFFPLSFKIVCFNHSFHMFQLTAPIQYNQNQSPITLTNSPPSGGQQCTLSGWGKTSTGGSLARNLLKMNQAVVATNQCQQIHRSMPLDNTHLCTLNRSGIGACQVSIIVEYMRIVWWYFDRNDRFTNYWKDLIVK